MSQNRIYRYDNIRLLLIFLVILGHGMELFLTPKVTILYRIVYSFHMPAFLYLSGKFAKFHARKVWKHLIFPYFVFQTVYLIFAAYVINGTSVSFQYTTPFWLLWYLLTMIIYYLLLPLLPKRDSEKGWLVVAATVVIALVAGFDANVGYYMSLSRTLVFAPFFFAAYYGESMIQAAHCLTDKHSVRNCMESADIVMRETASAANPFASKIVSAANPVTSKIASTANPATSKIASTANPAAQFPKSSPAMEIGTRIISTLIILFGMWYVSRPEITSQILYGSSGYEAIGANAIQRAILYLIAAAWIYLLLSYVPNREIPTVTALGQNTMPIFLLHAFVILLLSKYGVFHYSAPINFIMLCVIAVVMILIFGNQYVGKLFSKIF